MARKSIRLDNGEDAEAVFPPIISASRRTDIPAFYADWFFNRLEKGYSAWKNPFNGRISHVGFSETKFMVFWSKNPRPLLAYLDYLNGRGTGCYINFTLNDYVNEQLEPGLPPLSQRIETFAMLSEKLGKKAVIWRFDPLILAGALDQELLLSRIEYLAKQLHKFTNRLVFSFADITQYRKVRLNLEKKQIIYRDWTREMMAGFMARLAEMRKKSGWKFVLASCCEEIRLPGIEQNRCIDNRLMSDLCGSKAKLAELFKNGKRASGQRKFCNCAESTDIGQYDTCLHGCVYCYASRSEASVARNHARHHANPWSAMIAPLI